MFLPSHFLAQPLPGGGGYTWTLPSLLGDMLDRAQTQFGPRDLSYTLPGVEFGFGLPCIWWPGHRKDLVISAFSYINSE